MTDRRRALADALRHASAEPRTAPGMHAALAHLGERFWPMLGPPDPDDPDACWRFLGPLRRATVGGADPAGGRGAAHGPPVPPARAMVAVSSLVHRGPGDGTGMMQRKTRAARIAWELAGVGPLDGVDLAAPTCGDARCCRPAHHPAVPLRHAGDAKNAEGVLSFMIGADAAAAWWAAYTARRAAPVAPPAPRPLLEAFRAMAGSAPDVQAFGACGSGRRLWGVLAPFLAPHGWDAASPAPADVLTAGSPLWRDDHLAGAVVMVAAGDLHAALAGAAIGTAYLAGRARDLAATRKSGTRRGVGDAAAQADLFPAEQRAA